MRAFTSAKSIINEISQSHGFAGRLWEYRMQKQWKTLVGETTAAHTWPTRIKFHKLHVLVDNSVWLHQLTYLKRSLLEKIQSEMTELSVDDVIFRIGELPDRSKEDSLRRRTEPMEPEEAEKAIFILDVEEDPSQDMNVG